MVGAHSTGLQPRWLQHLLSLNVISLRFLLLLDFSPSLGKEKGCMINSAFNIGCECQLRKPLHGMAAEKSKKCLCFVRRNTLCCVPCHSHQQSFNSSACEPAKIQQWSQVLNELRWSGSFVVPVFLSHHFLTLQPDWTCGMLILKSVGNSQQAEIPLTSVSFLSMPEASMRTCTRRQSLKCRWGFVFPVLAVVAPQRHTGTISYSIILNPAKFVTILTVLSA